MQLCRRSQRAAIPVHERNETLAESVAKQLPRATNQEIDNPSRPSIDPTIGSVDPTEAAVPGDDNSYLQHFDSFMDTAQSGEIGSSILDRSNASDFDEWNTSTPTFQSSARADDSSVSFSNTTAPTSSSDSSSVSKDSLQFISPPAFHPPLRSLYEDTASTNIFSPNHVLNLSDLESMGRESQLVEPINLEVVQHKTVSSHAFRAQSSVPNRNSENYTVLDTSGAPSARGRDLSLHGTRPGTDLSALVNGLRNHTLVEQRRVEDVLTMSSGSTTSGRSRSKSSTASSEMLSHESLLMARIRSSPSDDEDIALLINDDLSIDAQNEKGETALHLAVKLGHISATKALLERGANVKMRDKKGRGVLIAARRVQRREKDNESLYARIAACMALAIDAGAVAELMITHHHHSAPCVDFPRSKYSDGHYHP